MSKTKRTKPAKPKAPEYPRVYEMFNNPAYELDRDAVTFAEPDCFNGRVRVRRYRITVELIDEPKEVLAERLRKLWRKADMSRQREPLEQAAKALGVHLESHEFGADAKRGRGI